MLGLQLGKTKYERAKASAAKNGAFMQEHQFICVTDGAVMTFLDDGPANPAKPPNPGRQKILAAVSKRILVNGEKVPVFYALKKGVEIFDNAANRPLPVPFYDDAAQAMTALFLEHRKQAAASSRQQWEGEKKKYAPAKKGDA
jgi:hypothetical protein